MLRAIGIPMIFLAMFTIAGGHWMVLQSVAWAQMVRNYSQDLPVSEAVAKTFSGEAPCSLCVKVAEGRKAEEKLPATAAAAKKIESFVSRATDSLVPPQCAAFSYSPTTGLGWVVRGVAPAAPVPRLGIA